MTDFLAIIPRTNRHWLYLLVAFLFMYQFASSQEYIFNHLTTKDGLSSNFVNCIYQDKKGYLWVVTESGLQRYDGYSFFYPYYNTPNQIPEKPVHQILDDKDGRMWIRQGRTIGIFNTSTFTFHVVPVHFKKPIPDVHEYQLHKDSRGNIYLLVVGYNWLYFNPFSFSFEETTRPFDISDSFGVIKITDDPIKKVTWVAGTQGLAMYDWQHKELYTHNNNPTHNPLLEDK